MHSCKSFSEMQFWIEGRIGALSPTNHKIYTISNEKKIFDPPNPKPKKIPKKREHLKKYSYYRQLPPDWRHHFFNWTGAGILGTCLQKLFLYHWRHHLRR